MGNSKMWHKNYYKNNESQRYYNWFKIYLMLEKRSEQAVANSANVNQSTISKVAQKFKWRKRANAWDSHFNKKWEENFREKFQAKLETDPALMIDRKMKQLADLEFVSDQMLENLIELLRQPVIEKVRRKKRLVIGGKKINDDDGNPVYLVTNITKPVRYSGGDIIKLADAIIILSHYLHDQITKLTAKEQETNLLNPQLLLQPDKPFSRMDAAEQLRHADLLRTVVKRTSDGENMEDVIQELKGGNN